MSELLTQEETELAIILNYERLKESRANDDSQELQDTFERRMNEALACWSDFHRYAAAVAVVAA